MGINLGLIAKKIGAAPIPAESTLYEVDCAAPLDSAKNNQISFLSNPKYSAIAKESAALAIITAKQIEGSAAIQLVVPNPYLAWAIVCELFAPERKSLLQGFIHLSAVVDPTATVSSDVHIGANSFIGPNTTIAKGCIIHSGVVIEENCSIGEGTEIHPNAVIHYNTVIGANCVIWSNVVIGAYGFGYALDGQQFVRIHQLGKVVIEDNVDIGACSTIDRGAVGDTVISKGVKIDNMVQIAHNVTIGDDSAIAAQSGLSGSLRIGKRVKIGGQAGFVGHIDIGDDSFVGAKAGVAKSFPPKSNITGYPARDFMEQRRLEASLLKVPELLKRVAALEKIALETKSIKGS